MDPLPKRKPNRLTGYDYSQPGAYFITICAKGRHAIFGTVCVGRDDLGAPYVKLSKYGTVIYALSDFLIMIMSWLVKQSLRVFLFQEVQL